MPSVPPPSAPGATTNPSGRTTRRPRYLVVALVASLVFGAGCWTEGCARLSFYRGEREHLAALNGAVHDETARARVEQRYQHFIDVADERRSRGIPVAAATFVLGAALLALAARAFGGRTNTRSALVQVVIAQALVVAAGYFVTKTTRDAELDWQVEQWLALQHETMPAEQYTKLVPMIEPVRRAVGPGWLVFRSLASALIVLALTRPRSRDFFEAAADSSVPE